MARRRKALALAAILVFSIGACAKYRVIEDGRLNQSAVNSVVKKTSEIRGLPLKKALPVEVVDAEQVRQELYAALEEVNELEKMRTYEVLLKRLRLLDAEVDLVQLVGDMLTSQVAGYYDPQKDVMRLVPGNASMGGAFDALEDILQRDLSGEFLLAHEVTHALADQHFDLEAFLEDTGDTDEATARKAFAEGEAMLVGMHYLLRRPLRKVAYQPANTEPKGETAAESFEKIPAVLKREIMFLYIDGFSFASAVYKREGASGLNRVYRRPPRSSEEILHPEKYFQADDPPVRINLPDEIPEMNGLVAVDEDTMGEVGVQALLIEPLGQEGARLAADGWGGDRFRLYRDPNDDERVGFIWLTAWDSHAEREEFTANVAQAMRRSFGEPERGDDLKWRTKEGLFVLRTSGEKRAAFHLLPPASR